MLGIRKRACVAWFVALLTLLACLGAKAEVPRRLTLMIYMCGSNLESSYGSASQDIQEMIDAGGGGSEVTVLIMTGGAQQWATGFDAGQCLVHELGPRGARVVWRSEAQSMGSSATLTQLLRLGREKYPADDYALILWDHGGGPMEGVCWDELFSLDRLSLDELTQALNDAELGKKLRWIGFDACLMGSLEVANAVAPYASYMIASQETEPSGGWNYAFLDGLAQDEDAPQTARRIVDLYCESDMLKGETLTLACLDLSQTQAVMDALEDCFQSRADRMESEDFVQLAGERVQATGFGEPLKAIGDGGYDLVDLEDLIARTVENTPESRALKNALAAFVVCNGANRQGANGISIYHPCFNKEQFQTNWRADYGRLKFSKAYARYINTYGNYLLADEMADWSGIGPVQSRLEEGDRQTFELALNEDQARHFSSGQLLILMGQDFVTPGVTTSFTIVGSSPVTLGADGTLRASWSGQSLYLNAEGVDRYGPLGYFIASDGESLVTEMTYIPIGGGLGADDTQGVFYYIAPPKAGLTAEITQVRVTDRVTGVPTNRIAFSEESYRGMYLWYPLKEMPEPDDRGLLPAFSLWSDDKNGVVFYQIPLPVQWHFEYEEKHQTSEQLWAMFEVTDVQQNTWCTPPVPMHNPNLIPAEVVQGTVETDAMKLTLSAAVDISEESPGIRLDYEIENKSGEPVSYTLKNIVLNGKRRVNLYGNFMDVGEDYSYYISERGIGSLLIPREKLVGLDALQTLTADLEISTKDYNDQTLPVEFAFSDCDLSVVAPDLQALAWAEQDGLLWQLLSLKHRYGKLALTLRVENRAAAEPVTGTMWALINGAAQLSSGFLDGMPEVGQDAIFEINPDKRIFIVGAMEDFYLKANDSGAALACYYLPDRLRSLGMTQIEEIALYRQDWDNTMHCLFRMPLDEPAPLPETDPPTSDLMDSIITLYEEESTPCALAEGSAIKFTAEHAVVGYNGVCLPVTLCNLSDSTVTLALEEAWINDIPVTVPYSGRSITAVPGGSVSSFYALGGEDQLPEGLAIREVRLGLRCSDESEIAWATMTFPEGTALSTPDGIILPADALKIEPAALPDHP